MAWYLVTNVSDVLTYSSFTFIGRVQYIDLIIVEFISFDCYVLLP